MKKTFLLLMSLCSFSLMGQMVFEKNTTWETVLAKAKSEKKLVFVDCYTTWCGPCKWLDKNTFPDVAVGEFFNANFVNLKVQMDTIAEDSEYTRKWWAVGQEFDKKYSIRAYPSFLVFNGDGELVDRGVGSAPPKEFIERGKEIIDPSKQFYLLKKKYLAGDKSASILKTLAVKNLSIQDKELASVGTEYLDGEKDLLTKENIDMIMSSSPAYGSKYFDFLANNKSKIEDLLGNKDVIDNFMFRNAGRKVIGKMTGPKVETVNWEALGDSLNLYYPKYKDEFVLRAKITRANGQKDWPAFSTATSEFMEKYGSKMSVGMMNSSAWAIFENCSDEACINRAISWIKTATEKEPSGSYLDTYANLMHKIGKTKEAIEIQSKGIAIDKAKGEDTKDLEVTLEKMKKGEKTWE
jgi:thiol-disulfide isomerase/thioredoxin